MKKGIQLLLLSLSFSVSYAGCTSSIKKFEAIRLPEQPTYFTESGLAVFRTGVPNEVPLLIIPGGPGASSKLYRRYLAPLARDRELVFWDYRSTGHSKALTSYGFSEDHQDLIEVIKSLNVKRIAILAHSYGGVHAMKFAAENPEMVEKLVLVSTSPHFLSSSQQSRILRSQNLGEFQFQRMRSIFSKLDQSRNANELEHELSIIEASNQLLNPTSARKQEFAQDAELNYQSVRQTEGWMEIDNRLILKKIRAKTLVLFAKKDIVVPPAYAQLIAQGIPTSTSATFENSRHWCFWEEQPKFILVVSKFLQDS